jgi:hypothetical protein
MGENIDGVKRKIKKLLSLSSSSNPYEAAAALEKAQELMREYVLHIDAAELADIGCAEVKTGSRGDKAPLHETMLMNAIARAFGCRQAYGYTSGRDWYKVHDFIGPEHRVRIASYIAEVLLRKMNRARAVYMKSLYRVRRKYIKTCRADEFCRGWVSAVIKKLQTVKNSPEEEKALDLYEQSLGWTDADAPAKRVSRNENDWYAGHASGKNIEIQSGVGVAGAGLFIESRMAKRTEE